MEAFGLKMKMNEWKHIFKLDPAKEIEEENLKLICQSGTDAIMIGGTDNITLEAVTDLYERVIQYTSVPIILEVSRMDAVMSGIDYYFIPMVFNSQEKKWMMDMQHQGIREYMDYIQYVDMVFEGYCVLNKDAKVFEYTNSFLPDRKDVAAYAYMAEHVYHLPIFYVEYSGTYGDVDMVKEAKSQLQNTLLFYGGGIQNRKQAKEMKQYADVIVVGNGIYENLEQAMETVHAVKGNNSEVQG